MQHLLHRRPHHGEPRPAHPRRAHVLDELARPLRQLAGGPGHGRRPGGVHRLRPGDGVPFRGQRRDRVRRRGVEQLAQPHRRVRRARGLPGTPPSPTTCPTTSTRRGTRPRTTPTCSCPPGSRRTARVEGPFEEPGTEIWSVPDPRLHHHRGVPPPTTSTTACSTATPSRTAPVPQPLARPRRPQRGALHVLTPTRTSHAAMTKEPSHGTPRALVGAPAGAGTPRPRIGRTRWRGSSPSSTTTVRGVPCLVIDLDVVADRYHRLCPDVSRRRASTTPSRRTRSRDSSGCSPRLGSSFDVASPARSTCASAEAPIRPSSPTATPSRRPTDIALRLRSAACGCSPSTARPSCDKLAEHAPGRVGVLPPAGRAAPAPHWPLSRKFGCAPDDGASTC